MSAESCQICGCTELSPCVDPFDGEPHPCGWIGPGICSACRYTPLAVAAPSREERLPSWAGLVVSPRGDLLPCIEAPPDMRDLLAFVDG